MSKPNLVPLAQDVSPDFVKGVSAAYQAAEMVDQVELSFMFVGKGKRALVCRIEIFQPVSEYDEDD